MQANAGPHVLALHMFFFAFCSKLTILYKFYLAGRRPTQVNEGPQRPTTANNGQRRPTKARSGQRWPTKANEGQRRPTRFGLTYVFFRVLFQTNYLIQVLFSRVQANAGRQRPTAANDGQRRPTQAHKDKKGPKQRVWHRLGHYMFFFKCTIYLLFFYY